MKLFVQNKILIFLVKYFRFTLIGVVIILLFVSLYFFLLPKYLEIREQGGLDYEAKVKILEAREKELEQLKTLQSKLAQITSVEIKRLEKILPTSSEISNIFIQMENLARESGLKVTRISVSPAEAIEAKGQPTTGENKQSGLQGKSIGVLTVSLTVEGDNTYLALKTFLDNVEDNMRLIDINALNYSSGQQQEKGSYSVNFRTYYLE